MLVILYDVSIDHTLPSIWKLHSTIHPSTSQHLLVSQREQAEQSTQMCCSPATTPAPHGRSWGILRPGEMRNVSWVSWNYVRAIQLVENVPILSTKGVRLVFNVTGYWTTGSFCILFFYFILFCSKSPKWQDYYCSTLLPVVWVLRALTRAPMTF